MNIELSTFRNILIIKNSDLFHEDDWMENNWKRDTFYKKHIARNIASYAVLSLGLREFLSKSAKLLARAAR